MKTNGFLMAGVLFLCIVAVGVVFFFAFVGPTPVAEVVVDEQVQETEVVRIHTSSREEIERNNPDGPWSRDLQFATSEDGHAFSAPQTLLERAGVPSVIRDAQGRLVAVFQWFPQDDLAWDKVAVMFSEDDGETWGDPVSVTIHGMPEDYQRAFDPTLALTTDGRLRLYFTSSTVSALREDPQEMETHIYSAISDDGVNYTFEEGTRLVVEGERVYDAAVLFLDELWHLLVPIGQVGAYHTGSADGLMFVEPEGISSTPWQWIGNLIAWNDGMRFYGGSQNGIWWAYSEDGADWTQPAVTNIQGGDPSVVALQDGSYLMIFVSKSLR